MDGKLDGQLTVCMPTPGPRVWSHASSRGLRYFSNMSMKDGGEDCQDLQSRGDVIRGVGCQRILPLTLEGVPDD